MPRLSAIRTLSLINVRRTHVVNILRRLEGGADFSRLCLDGLPMVRNADNDKKMRK